MKHSLMTWRKAPMAAARLTAFVLALAASLPLAAGFTARAVDAEPTHEFEAQNPEGQEPAAQNPKRQDWGVIIGTTLGGNLSRVAPYKNLVIDAQHYYPGEIRKLKSGGRKVYSYMSVGSLENYRPYYSRFKKYAFGAYENWPDEMWMNVGESSWQDFIVEELAASVRRKGCNGLWLDNFDVYYKYHRESIYRGLLNILTRLYNKGIPVYINGGDEFVTRLLAQGRGRLIKGVFQEEVITRIKSYSSNRFGLQLKSEREYFESYLRKVKRAGKSVVLLEYAKSSSVKAEVVSFAKRNRYSCFISEDVLLR